MARYLSHVTTQGIAVAVVIYLVTGWHVNDWRWWVCAIALNVAWTLLLTAPAIVPCPTTRDGDETP